MKFSTPRAEMSNFLLIINLFSFHGARDFLFGASNLELNVIQYNSMFMVMMIMKIHCKQKSLNRREIFKLEISCRWMFRI